MYSTSLNYIRPNCMINIIWLSFCLTLSISCSFISPYYNGHTTYLPMDSFLSILMYSMYQIVDLATLNVFAITLTGSWPPSLALTPFWTSYCEFHWVATKCRFNAWCQLRTFHLLNLSSNNEGTWPWDCLSIVQLLVSPWKCWTVCKSDCLYLHVIWFVYTCVKQFHLHK